MRVCTPAIRRCVSLWSSPVAQQLLQHIIVTSCEKKRMSSVQGLYSHLKTWSHETERDIKTH